LRSGNNGAVVNSQVKKEVKLQLIESAKASLGKLLLHIAEFRLYVSKAFSVLRTSMWITKALSFLETDAV